MVGPRTRKRCQDWVIRDAEHRVVACELVFKQCLREVAGVRGPRLIATRSWRLMARDAAARTVSQIKVAVPSL